MNTIDQVLYFAGGTIIEDIKESSNKAKLFHKTAGFTVIFASIFAIYSGYMLGSIFSGKFIYCLPPAVLYASFVFIFDRTVFITKSRWAKVLRIIVSFFISMIVVLPIMLKLFETRLTAEINNNNKEQYQKFYKNYQDKVLNPYKNKMEGVQKNIEKIEISIKNLESESEKERYGIERQKGEGDKFNYNNAQKIILQSELSIKKKRLLEIIQSFKADSALYNQNIDKKIIEEEKDFTSLYATLLKIQDNHPDKYIKKAALRENWLFDILIILIEMLPTILKMSLSQTDYDTRVDNGEKIKNREIEIEAKIKFKELEAKETLEILRITNEMNRKISEIEYNLSTKEILENPFEKFEKISQTNHKPINNIKYAIPIT